MKYLSIFSFLILILISCNESKQDKQQEVTTSEIESDFSKCPNGAIPPIFDADSSGFVVDQNHEIQKGLIKEQVIFADGIQLELIQSGCYVLKQNYKFKFPKRTAETNPQFWLALAMGQFEKMANVDEGFLNIAQLIYQNGGQMKLGEPFNGLIPMGEGYEETSYTLIVDKFETDEEQLLVVNFDLVYPK